MIHVTVQWRDDCADLDTDLPGDMAAAMRFLRVLRDLYPIEYLHGEIYDRENIAIDDFLRAFCRHCHTRDAAEIGGWYCTECEALQCPHCERIIDDGLLLTEDGRKICEDCEALPDPHEAEKMRGGNYPNT